MTKEIDNTQGHLIIYFIICLDLVVLLVKMCEIVVSKSQVLKNIVDSCLLLSEGIWNFFENEITMQSIDPSHVFVCEMKLSKELFSKYSHKNSVSVGIQFNNLAKVLKSSPSDEPVSLKINDKTNIDVSFKNKASSRSSKFSIKAVEIEHEEINILERTFDCKVVINNKELKNVLSDLVQFGDECVITAEKESVDFSVKGGIGDGNITLTGLKIEVINPVKLTFSIKHLINFTKTVSLSEDVNIGMSDGFPMMLEYSIDTNSYIKFHLAPKSETE